MFSPTCTAYKYIVKVALGLSYLYKGVLMLSHCHIIQIDAAIIVVVMIKLLKAIKT